MYKRQQGERSEFWGKHMARFDLRGAVNVLIGANRVQVECLPLDCAITDLTDGLGVSEDAVVSNRYFADATI
jgi:hypothetical protein